MATVVVAQALIGAVAAAAGGTSVILLPNQSSSTLLAAAKHLRRTLVSIGIDDTLANIVHVVDKDEVLEALRRADGCVAGCVGRQLNRVGRSEPHLQTCCPP